MPRNMIPQFKQEMRVSPEYFTEWSIRYLPLTAARLQGNIINMQKTTSCFSTWKHCTEKAKVWILTQVQACQPAAAPAMADA